MELCWTPPEGDFVSEDRTKCDATHIQVLERRGAIRISDPSRKLTASAAPQA